jgi:hypothetical protein
MKLARCVFLTAGILGLLPVVPLAYAAMVNEQIMLPDVGSASLFFYGFVFQYVCWQILYIVLARDPVRYRPMMILAFLAQVIAPLYPAWLYLYGFRLWISIVVVDLVLAMLFLVAFWLTGRKPNWSAA